MFHTSLDLLSRPFNITIDSSIESANKNDFSNLAFISDNRGITTIFIKLEAMEYDWSDIAISGLSNLNSLFNWIRILFK